MTLTTYGIIESNVQSTIYGILSADSSIATMTNNIMDGMPPNLSKGLGFPYIIIHTPTVEEQRLTNTKFFDLVTVHIQIYDKKEGNVRQLAGYVRNALRTNQSTTRDAALFWYNRSGNRTALNYEFLIDESSQPVWVWDFYATYKWYGGQNIA